MNKDIVLFSTRNIGDEKTIFQNTTRMDEPSQSLCEYFLKENADDLYKLKTLFGNDKVAQSDANCSNAETPKTAIKQLKDLARSIIKSNEVPISTEDTNKLTNLYRAEVPDYSKFFDTIKNIIDNYQLEQHKECLAKIETTHEKERGSSFSFIMEDYNNEEYLKSEAINTAKPKDKLTLRDRISLFKVCDNYIDESQKDSYIAYAVLPLGKADKDEGEGETHKSKWVDALVDAVLEAETTKEESEATKENDTIRLILMLHDKDLANQDGKDLDTIYIEREIKNIKLTFCVFAHPNSKYRQLINNSSVDAKEIFNNVDNITIRTNSLRLLKNISSLITDWSEGNDGLKKEELKKVAGNLGENFAKELTSSIDTKTPKGIYELNQRVNKLILDLEK